MIQTKKYMKKELKHELSGKDGVNQFQNFF